MAYSPYDWNENVRHRSEYIENILREGSPVVGISCVEGVLMLTLRRQQQRKIFEIYDRMIFSGIGRQSDIESVRITAIDLAHQEGFTRSPDDVSAQRIVGFAVSPALKKAFSDPFGGPFVLRGLFAEMAHAPEDDLFYTLNYDGEFTAYSRYSVVAGTQTAEDRMLKYLMPGESGDFPDLNTALDRAIRAWGSGRRISAFRSPEEETELGGEEAEAEQLRQFLTTGLGDLVIEAALLERNTRRENKFRVLRDVEVRPRLQALADGKEAGGKGKKK
jgi:proteasome alpha subunit